MREGGAFFNKRRRGLARSDRPQHLCVENPLDPSHDVGANSYNIGAVRRAFCHGYFVLLGVLQHEAPAAAAAADPAAAESGVSSARLRCLRALCDMELEMGERFRQHALDGEQLRDGEGCAGEEEEEEEERRHTPEAVAAEQLRRRARGVADAVAAMDRDDHAGARAAATSCPPHHCRGRRACPNARAHSPHGQAH